MKLLVKNLISRNIQVKKKNIQTQDKGAKIFITSKPVVSWCISASYLQ